mmetsp:Transcript_3987/g.8215  ORF Transcript_3987/g.8215 Transcript_3987/m.8215 type:complete len:265 (-) Transcript_3987:632-1426(-)
MESFCLRPLPRFSVTFLPVDFQLRVAEEACSAMVALLPVQRLDRVPVGQAAPLLACIGSHDTPESLGADQKVRAAAAFTGGVHVDVAAVLKWTRLVCGVHAIQLLVLSAADDLELPKVALLAKVILRCADLASITRGVPGDAEPSTSAFAATGITLTTAEPLISTVGLEMQPMTMLAIARQVSNATLSGLREHGSEGGLGTWRQVRHILGDVLVGQHFCGKHLHGLPDALECTADGAAGQVATNGCGMQGGHDLAQPLRTLGTL